MSDNIHESSDDQTRRALNRLLAIEGFSLANYLLGAPPWISKGEEPLVDLVRRIANEQHAMAVHVGKLLVERYGFAETAKFPLRFAAYDDLALHFLLRKLIEEQRRMISEIQECLQQLHGDAAARQLAEDVLNLERQHLEVLSELPVPDSLKSEGRAAPSTA